MCARFADGPGGDAKFVKDFTASMVLDDAEVAIASEGSNWDCQESKRGNSVIDFCSAPS